MFFLLLHQFVLFSSLVSYELGLLYIGSCFCFDLVEDRRKFTLFAPSFLSLGRGVGPEASVKVWWRLTMVFGFVCLATWWRGAFE